MSAKGGNRGLPKLVVILGFCLLLGDDERNEPPNDDNGGDPRKLRLGDATVPNRSIDFLKKYYKY